jgi:hypothetical protein
LHETPLTVTSTHVGTETALPPDDGANQEGVDLLFCGDRLNEGIELALEVCGFAPPPEGDGDRGRDDQENGEPADHVASLCKEKGALTMKKLMKVNQDQRKKRFYREGAKARSLNSFFYLKPKTVSYFSWRLRVFAVKTGFTVSTAFDRLF